MCEVEPGDVLGNRQLGQAFEGSNGLVCGLQGGITATLGLLGRTGWRLPIGRPRMSRLRLSRLAVTRLAVSLRV